MVANKQYALSALVARKHNVNVEWNAAFDRLRVADASNDETIAVFGNGELYKVAAAAPAGHVFIREVELMPRIAHELQKAGFVKIIQTIRDHHTNEEIFLAQVLID